jgi:hypothetical protein
MFIWMRYCGQESMKKGWFPSYKVRVGRKAMGTGRRGSGGGWKKGRVLSMLRERAKEVKISLSTPAAPPTSAEGSWGTRGHGAGKESKTCGDPKVLEGNEIRHGVCFGGGGMLRDGGYVWGGRK